MKKLNKKDWKEWQRFYEFTFGEKVAEKDMKQIIE